MMYELIDSLTFPFRWCAAMVMSFVAAEYLDRIDEETPLIARRMVEAALDDVGMNATCQQFLDALGAGIDGLVGAHPAEHRLLVAYAAIAGLKARDALWRYEVDVALQRRCGI